MKAENQQTGALSVEQADFRGWPAVYLRNGLVTLAAVPDIGGRIMACDLGDYPFLFVDPTLAGRLFSAEENQGDGSLAAWKNYGGDKTWPSPQGWDTDDQWHGPPDPVLDTGKYTLAALGCTSESASLRMVSPPDPRTGIQITRQATLPRDSSRVTLELTFTNISSHQVRWSIWDVVQLRAERRSQAGELGPELDCIVTTPLNPNSRFPRGFQVMFGSEDNPQWTTDVELGLFVARYRWEIGKTGIDSPAGWVAFSNAASGYALVERFPYFPGADYPDGGASVECWTIGKGRVANLDYEVSQIYLMEAEVLSPLYTFEPGEAHTFTLEWGLCRCPGPVTKVHEAGCTGGPLRCERTRQGLRIAGAFGVFEPGELALTWKDQTGVQLAEPEVIGAVDPRQAVYLDQVITPPAQAAWLELQVTPADSGVTRLLVREAI